MTDEEYERRDEMWRRGERAAYVSILHECLRHLGYDGTEAEHAKWILEREAAVAQLRSVCEDYGDNDWPNDLHLADVIDKHLHRHLSE